MPNLVTLLKNGFSSSVTICMIVKLTLIMGVL